VQEILIVSAPIKNKEEIINLAFVRREEGMEYEKINWILRILSVPFILILNVLPAFISSRIFLAFGGKKSDPKMVFENVATFQALEVLYTYHHRKVNFISAFWQNFLFNAISIRNRLQLVKKEISTGIREASRRQEIVRLLSVGSGSARPVLETISSLGDFPTVEIMLVDVDNRAIQFSQVLATKLQLNHTQWHCGNFFRLEQYCRDFRPDIVEMIGLLDYLTDKQAIALLRKIFSVLAPEGKLITSNITPNLEVPFVTKAIHWPMIYRSPVQLFGLLTEAGFPANSIELVQEPLGIHTLAIVKKLLDPY